MLCEEFKIVYKIAVGLPIAVYRLTLKWGEKIPPSPRNNKCKALLLYAFKCPCSPRAPNSGNKVRLGDVDAVTSTTCDALNRSETKSKSRMHIFKPRVENSRMCSLMFFKHVKF